jgi:hypothetical protein
MTSSIRPLGLCMVSASWKWLPPPFFFPMPVHIWVTRIFWQAISDYVFFLVRHPSEPHIQAFMLSLAEVISSLVGLVGREGVCIRCHPSIHPSIHPPIHLSIHPSQEQQPMLS